MRYCLSAFSDFLIMSVVWVSLKRLSDFLKQVETRTLANVAQSGVNSVFHGDFSWINNITYLEILNS